MCLKNPKTHYRRIYFYIFVVTTCHSFFIAIRLRNNSFTFLLQFFLLLVKQNLLRTMPLNGTGFSYQLYNNKLLTNVASHFTTCKRDNQIYSKNKRNLRLAQLLSVTSRMEKETRF